LQDDLDFGPFNFNTGYAIGGEIPSTTGGEEMVFQGWIPANSADYKAHTDFTSIHGTQFAYLKTPITYISVEVILLRV
jgi:hypothetical protein